MEESLFECFGAQRRIFFSLGWLSIPESIWDNFCLGAMDGPPFEKPKRWLALRFSKLELRIELDEPGMGHFRKLNEKYFIPCINIIIVCVPKTMFIKRSSNPGISPISEMSKFNDLNLVEQKLIFSFWSFSIDRFYFH